jgi:hypothetical protein
VPGQDQLERSRAQEVGQDLMVKNWIALKILYILLYIWLYSCNVRKPSVLAGIRTHDL